MIASVFLAASLIDFTCRPATLEALRPRLEDAFGAKVAIGTDLQNEVVVISAQGVEPTILREKIAAVVCGKWEERPAGRWFLTLDTEEQKRREDALREGYAEAFRALRERALAPFLVGIRQPWNAKELAIEMTSKWNTRLRYRLPSEIMGVEIMAEISPDDVARAAMGETVVLSNRPTELMGPLPGSADGIAQKRGTQMAELTRILGTMGWTGDADFGLMIGQAARMRYRPWDEGPYWIVYRPGTRGEEYALNSLFIADKNGDLIESPFTGGVVELLTAASAGRPAPYGSQHAEVLGEDRTFEDEVAEDAYKSGRLRWPDRMIEPLEKRFQDRWSNWAVAEGAPICINLPDSLSELGLGENTKNMEKSPNDLGRLADDEILVQKGSDGWITGIPLYPSDIRRLRVPRFAFEQLQQAMRKGVLPPIEQQLGDAGWMALAVFKNDPFSSFDVLGLNFNEAGLGRRVFLGLSSQFLKSGAKGFKGTMADLAASDQRAIKDWIVGRNEWMDDEALTKGGNLKLSEPAILFAASPPSEFSVELKLDSEDIVFGVRRVEPEGEQFYSLATYAVEELENMEFENGEFLPLGKGRKHQFFLSVDHKSGLGASQYVRFTEGSWKTEP